MPARKSCPELTVKFWTRFSRWHFNMFGVKSVFSIIVVETVHFWTWNWSHTLSSCCYCSCCWADLFKKPKAPSFQIGSGWKLAGLFFR